MWYLIVSIQDLYQFSYFVIVLCRFPTVPREGLQQRLIMVCPDHTLLLFYIFVTLQSMDFMVENLFIFSLNSYMTNCRAVLLQ